MGRREPGERPDPPYPLRITHILLVLQTFLFGFWLLGDDSEALLQAFALGDGEGCLRRPFTRAVRPCSATTCLIAKRMRSRSSAFSDVSSSSFLTMLARAAGFT